MNSIKVCEYSRSRSFHDDLILQDQASGERSQDQWSSGFKMNYGYPKIELWISLNQIIMDIQKKNHGYPKIELWIS